MYGRGGGWLYTPVSERRFCALSASKALVCAAVSVHIKDPVPLIEKSRALCPGGRSLPSFIHQVIIITGLNKL